jgi:BlaI family transcriptional regulator, penicillinase repressor
MPIQRRHVADAELAVLEVLWDHSPRTIRQLTDILYPGGTTSEYATVQKLLQRLEDKGCVSRDRSQSAHQFSPNIARDDLIGEQLEQVAQKLCDGSLTPLLLHLTSNVRLKKRERELLKKMIDDAK